MYCFPIDLSVLPYLIFGGWGFREGLKEKREIDVFLQFILRHSPCGRVHMEGIDRVGDGEDPCGNISGKAGGRISEGLECPLCVIGRKDAMCMIR